MPCHAMPCHAMPCHAMPFHAMPCHAMPCHVMPCHAMLCHAMPCHVMPCHVMPSQAKPSQAKPSQAKPRHALPCYAMLCHAMPCHAMPCHAMPCHAMPCHAIFNQHCYAMLFLPTLKRQFLLFNVILPSNCLFQYLLCGLCRYQDRRKPEFGTKPYTLQYTVPYAVLNVSDLWNIWKTVYSQRRWLHQTGVWGSIMYGMLVGYGSSVVDCVLICRREDVNLSVILFFSNNCFFLDHCLLEFVIKIHNKHDKCINSSGMTGRKCNFYPI